VPDDMRSHHPRSQRGSVWMLAPALVLVLMGLGALGADLALLHAAHRSAYRSLSAAADDAAAMVDARELQLSGAVRLDPQRAEAVARAHLGLLGQPGSHRAEGAWAEPAFDVTAAEIDADPARGTVQITATVEVDHVFLAAVPGIDSTTEIRVSTTGRMMS